MVALQVHTPSPSKRPTQSCLSPMSEECEHRAVPWHCAEGKAYDAPPSPFAGENRGQDMACAIASWIDGVVERYDAMEKITPSKITVFHAQSTPEISVRDYLIRINKYGGFSNSVTVAALIYIDRVIEDNPHIVVSSRTVHRLLITAMLLAAKFNDDVHLGNAAFAQIGGIRTPELNRLEVHFLKLCQFNLVVSAELYATTVSAFETHDSGVPPRIPTQVDHLAIQMAGLGSPLCKEWQSLFDAAVAMQHAEQFRDACPMVSAS